MVVMSRHCWRVSSAGTHESSDVNQVQWDERHIVTSHQGNGWSQIKMYAVFVFWFRFVLPMLSCSHDGFFLVVKGECISLGRICGVL